MRSTLALTDCLCRFSDDTTPQGFRHLLEELPTLGAGLFEEIHLPSPRPSPGSPASSVRGRSLIRQHHSGAHIG